jgi:hypothetical protein
MAGGWFSPGTPVSPTNKTDCHDITDIVESGVWTTIQSRPWQPLFNAKWISFHLYDTDEKFKYCSL